MAEGPRGERRLSVAESFGGFLQTALDPREVLTEIRVPKTGSGGWAYEKFNRRSQDWATVAVAAVQMNGGAHVALTNMGPTALRAGGVEKALSSGADPAEAAEKAAEGTSPPSDHNASAGLPRAPRPRAHAAGARGGTRLEEAKSQGRMPDRRLTRSRMTPATRRRITTLALARTSRYGQRAIAAPGLVADAPDEHPSRRPSI